MNYLFAPSQDRADWFLRNNGFGLDRYNTRVRLSYNNRWTGEKYSSDDTLYILDGCGPEMTQLIEYNVSRSPSAPQGVSVEER